MTVGPPHDRGMRVGSPTQRVLLTARSLSDPRRGTRCGANVGAASRARRSAAAPLHGYVADRNF